MARLSDIIEDFIKKMIEENEESELEIQRNELANYFSCAPSQINYVLTTRFTTEKGYYIESKRGGGGCIKIRRLQFTNYEPLIEKISEKIGNSITYDGAMNIINWLYECEIITIREANIMKIAINDRTLSSYFDNKNNSRADILKAMVTVALM